MQTDPMQEEVSEQAGEEQEETQNVEVEAETEQQTEYEPNFNYSVKSESHEFDEWIRPLVKDTESEEHVRQLYTRAKGLDHVKA
ncbi:unnamed protein product, partial [marine sediment metagenome]